MKLSFGIIGCGKIAGNYKINNKKFLENFTHSSAFIKYFYPLICIDKDIKKAKKFKKKWNYKFCENKLDLLNKFIPDILIVAVDTSQHFQVLSKILKLKLKPKIVICEKPLTNNFKFSKIIISEFKKNKIKLITNYQRRWDKKNIFIQKKIKNNDFGEFKSGYCSYSKGVLNSASHFIDLFTLFFDNLNIKRLQGFSFNSPSINDKTEYFVLYTNKKKTISFLPINSDENKSSEIKLFFSKYNLYSNDGCLSWKIQKNINRNILRYEKEEIKKFMPNEYPSIKNLALIIYNYLSTKKGINFDYYNKKDLKVHEMIKKLYE